MPENNYLKSLIDDDHVQNRSEKFLSRISPFDEEVLKAVYDASHSIPIKNIKNAINVGRDRLDKVNEDEIEDCLEQFKELDVIAETKPANSSKSHYVIHHQNENLFQEFEKPDENNKINTL